MPGLLAFSRRLSKKRAYRTRHSLSAPLHVDKIRSEILILHGRHDARASVTQPKAFFDALSAVGVTVALNLFECGHRIPREDTTRGLPAFFKKVYGSGVTHH